MEKEQHWNDYDEVGIGVGAYTDVDKLSEITKDKSVLEVGCGRGLMLNKLSLAKSRAGIDPSSRAIELAQKSNSQIDFQVASAENLPYPDNSFDSVFSLEVIEHVKDYEGMVNEIYRVLKPGGLLFIQTPNYPVKRFYDFIYWIFKRRKELADDYTHVTKLSSFKLRSIIGKKFKIQNFYSRNMLLESKLEILRNYSVKKSVGLVLGQKTIIVALK